MTRWLRGKPGFTMAFLVVAVLVTGGLGWATWVVVALEQQQRLAQAQSERNARLRLALWRLDARLFPMLAREGNRPFTHYRTLASIPAAIVPRDQGRSFSTCEALLPSPLLDEPLPAWLKLHFQVNPRQVPALWESPQVPSAGDMACISQAQHPLGSFPGDQELRRTLESLQARLKPELVTAWLAEQRQQLEAEAEAEVRTERTAASDRAESANDLGADVSNEPGPRAPQRGGQMVSPQVDNEFQNRAMQKLQLERLGPYLGQAPALASPATVEVRVGPLRSWWAEEPGSPDVLLVARWVQVGQTEYCQGMVLDESLLRSELAATVADLFPKATLVRQTANETANPEQSLAALPFDLEPNEPLTLPHAREWTTFQVGLCFAWIAAALGLTVVGLGGWSLLELSERRIRFVSTVTHELRTPLTTLRLYAEMLSSGIVAEPKQQREYVRTLHQEAERLHRLIANVLDYSRLERSRVAVKLADQPVAAILETLRETWTERCRQAQKELCIAAPEPPDLTVATDQELVQQVLGNLLDNACKYSQQATDHRIVVRSRAEGSGLAVIEVEDYGPGIPFSTARRVFQAFERGHQVDASTPGVGLGLALARRWTNLLGGKLEMRSTGRSTGVCFRLLLPTARVST